MFLQFALNFKYIQIKIYALLMQMMYSKMARKVNEI